MNEFAPWHNEALGKKVVEALKKNGFEAEYCSSAAEAADKVLALIPESASVGFGGSWTVKALGIQEKLAGKGNTLLDHGAPGLSNEERHDCQEEAAHLRHIPFRNERGYS